MGIPMGHEYNDVQMNPDVIENMFGMNPGRQMAFGTANEGFGFTVIFMFIIINLVIIFHNLLYKFTKLI